jgi:hypothetical protein
VGAARPRSRPAPLYPSPNDYDDFETISTDDGTDLSDRSGFLRVGPPPVDLPVFEAGPRWQIEEADSNAHEFLEVLAGGRKIEHRDDPIEHARDNALLLLFGAEELAAFETLLARMPRERAAEWRELLSGGASSEAFGPLTLQERLDERQVEHALVEGRRQRLINLSVGSVVTLVVLVGAVAGFGAITSRDHRTSGALRFDPLVESGPGAVAGGPPVAVEALTASLSTIVAVAPGEGPPEDRIVNAPFAVLPQPPGATRAGVFEYGGAGQVAVVGPAGWLNEPTCLRASVVSADLRALDTVTWESQTGACPEPIGRVATPVCAGDSAVLLEVRIPVGEVVLPEGGAAFADAIRVQLVGSPTPEYELLTVRGLIAVPVDTDVVIPSFGGAPGDEIRFDLGADRSGTCTIAGG